MGLSPKGLDAFEEPRLLWLAGFGPQCALQNFYNSSSGTCMAFGKRRATVSLKASANLCFSQTSALQSLVGGGGRQHDFSEISFSRCLGE